MERLVEVNIGSIMIEGGGEVNASALNAGIVDKILFFVSPKIIGGTHSITAVEGKSVVKVNEALKVEQIELKRFKDDIMVEGYISKRR